MTHQSEYLTKPALLELAGCKRKATLMRWLSSRRIPYITDSAGWPIVRKNAIDSAMSIETINLDCINLSLVR